MKLIWLVRRRSWRANGPKRRATSALKTTAVNVKRAIAELTLRLEIWVDLGAPLIRKYVARLTERRIRVFLRKNVNYVHTRNQGEHVGNGSSHPKGKVELRTCQNDK